MDSTSTALKNEILSVDLIGLGKHTFSSIVWISAYTTLDVSTNIRR